MDTSRVLIGALILSVVGVALFSIYRNGKLNTIVNPNTNTIVSPNTKPIQSTLNQKPTAGAVFPNDPNGIE